MPRDIDGRLSNALVKASHQPGSEEGSVLGVRKILRNRP